MVVDVDIIKETLEVACGAAPSCDLPFYIVNREAIIMGVGSAAYPIDKELYGGGAHHQRCMVPGVIGQVLVGSAHLLPGCSIVEPCQDVAVGGQNHIYLVCTCEIFS